MLENAVWGSAFESIPGYTGDMVTDVLRESLLQPQGWSLRSITDNLSEELGVDRGDARLVARTETSKVLNEAREEGYERLGELDSDDRLFKWIGPSDTATTDVCQWLKDQTEGGVTWDRLIELQKEAYDVFDDEIGHLDWRKHSLHPNERHTFVETFKMDHPGAAGPVEVEREVPMGTAIGGTFKAVGKEATA